MKDKIFSRHKKYFLAILITSLSSFPVFATPSSANVKNCETVPGGITCGGNIGGNPGTHSGTGGGGSGYWNGHTAQLNGYMPIQNPSVTEYPNPDRGLFPGIGYSTSTPGPYYEHYQVAIDRNTGEALGGAPGTKFWDTSWNLDTYNRSDGSGVNRADVPPGHDPSLNDQWHGWAGKNWWLFSRSKLIVECLPLTGSVPQDVLLQQLPPTITFGDELATLSDKTIELKQKTVGMKSLKVTFEVTPQSLQSAADINFDFEKYNISVIRFLKDGTGEWVVESWKLSDAPDCPIKFKKISRKDKKDPKQTYAMKIYKKGRYLIVAQALFTGTVIINGNPVSQSNLPATSVSNPFNAIGLKSILRARSLK